MKILRWSLVVLILLFIFRNLTITFGLIHGGSRVLDGFDHFPGSDFLFLKADLKQQYHVGYIVQDTPDWPNLNANYARRFSAAQFALAPAILNHDHPWDWDYVIAVADMLNVDRIIGFRPFRIIRQQGNIFLLKRVGS